jgi:hypothetical protein
MYYVIYLMIIYLIMLLMAHIRYCWMIGWVVDFNLKKVWKEAFVTLIKVLSQGYAMAEVACHCRGPGSCPSQSLWDLWWTKWHRDRFFSDFLFRFPIRIIPLGLYTHISSGWWTIGPLVSTVKRHSLTVSTWTRCYPSTLMERLGKTEVFNENRLVSRLRYEPETSWI